MYKKVLNCANFIVFTTQKLIVHVVKDGSFLNFQTAYDVTIWFSDFQQIENPNDRNFRRTGWQKFKSFRKRNETNS